VRDWQTGPAMALAAQNFYEFLLRESVN